jgi:Tfp pilus assembly protein PilN
MAARKKEEINLLPQRGFESTTTGRVLAWILSSFRIIVIVTEIIVMIAFLSRFWLDAQNTDLTDELESKQAILASSLKFEKEFKETQNRLGVYSDITSYTLPKASIANTISTLLPPDIFLSSVVFSADAVAVSGISPNERSIQQFVVNLNSSDYFEKAHLLEIKSDEEDVNSLLFQIQVILGKEKV